MDLGAPYGAKKIKFAKRQKETEMKKTGKIIICILILALACSAILGGCDLVRKVKGAELGFQKKLKAATEVSFDMHLDITKSGVTSGIDLSCYKKGDEYAYTFSDPALKGVTYRKLFADNCKYEFCETTTLLNVRTGTYVKTEDVPYTDDSNLLYVVTKNIMLVTVAAFITKAEKETLGDTEVYHYSFDYNGDQYHFWYDAENLVKVSATFNSEDENGVKSSETYAATFTNYRFEKVAGEPFLRPVPISYVESPYTVEEWMEILTEFGARAGNWM